MPVINVGNQSFPAWCELESFEIVTLAEGGSQTFSRVGRREKLIIARGACRLVSPNDQGLDERAIVDLGPDQADARFEVREAAPGTVVVRMAGRWGEETGGAGLFGVVRSEEPRDVGDPVTYRKETNFDAHYHDCDEYWIVLEGRGTAVSEGKLNEVGPGDCVATGMGHHHDFPLVSEAVRAVFFETTLEGQKRRGHLWDHTHGPAAPQSNRV